jgi:hypothetical protein
VSASARLLRSMTEDELLWSQCGEVRLCGREISVYTIPALAVITGRIYNFTLFDTFNITTPFFLSKLE